MTPGFVIRLPKFPVASNYYFHTLELKIKCLLKNKWKFENGTSLVKVHTEARTHVLSHLFVFQLTKSRCLCSRLEDPWLLALESVNLVQTGHVLVRM